MTEMREPMHFEKAQVRLLNEVEPLATQLLPVEQALGYYLAQDHLARRTQPAAPLSAMDGYAMRADDLAGPWRLVGESAAGHPFAGELAAGDAVRISTGALLPEGAGAILLQENALRNGDLLACAQGSEATARHVRQEGFDFGAGDAVLAGEMLFGPAQLALALSAGLAEVSVVRRPRIAVLDSGDELVADPASAARHQIPASNAAMLAAMTPGLTRECLRFGPVADNLADFVAALDRAGDVDVIVTSGGASVGDHDHLRPALAEWGARVDFWRVAMKPGKPLLVARKGQQVILGLPGNPVSSYVTAYFFLLPLLRRLGGAPIERCLPQPFTAPLSAPLGTGGDRLEFVRGRFANGQVETLPLRDSSALRTLALADCLVEIGAGQSARAIGEPARIYPLQNGGIA